MNKKDLLFYDAYEEFYTMAENSQAFKLFCKDAFGQDFSQDGFSDIKQINRIFQYIPKKRKCTYFGYWLWKWKNAWLYTGKNRSIYTWI